MGKYKRILSSDETRFGGTGTPNKKELTARKIPEAKQDYSIEMNLPPLSVTVYSFDFKG